MPHHAADYGVWISLMKYLLHIPVGMPHHAADHATWVFISTMGFILIEVSYLPQLIRLYIVKEAHEFHLLYPFLNLCGRIIALAAAFVLKSQGITLGLAIGILVRLTLLFQVWYYRRREERIKQMALEAVSL